jgi:CDP-diacylglycerol--glycerol-3-phosphate 3-phosphatidyltransferase
LIIILVAVGFHGLGVPYILAIGIWSLAVLGLVTVLQRLQVVRKGLADS